MGDLYRIHEPHGSRQHDGKPAGPKSFIGAKSSSSSSSGVYFSHMFPKLRESTWLELGDRM